MMRKYFQSCKHSRQRTSAQRRRVKKWMYKNCVAYVVFTPSVNEPNFALNSGLVSSFLQYSGTKAETTIHTIKSTRIVHQTNVGPASAGELNEPWIFRKKMVVKDSLRPPSMKNLITAVQKTFFLIAFSIGVHILFRDPGQSLHTRINSSTRRSAIATTPKMARFLRIFLPTPFFSSSITACVASSPGSVFPKRPH